MMPAKFCMHAAAAACVENPQHWQSSLYQSFFECLMASTKADLNIDSCI